MDGDLAERRFVALYRQNGVAAGVLGWKIVDALRDRDRGVRSRSTSVPWFEAFQSLQ